MPGTTLSPEEQAKLASIRGELEAVAKAQVETGIKTAEEMVAKVEKAMEKITAEVEGLKAKAGVHVPGLDKQEAEKFSFARASLAMAKKDWSKAGFENEVLLETMKNAQTRGTAGEGGYLVPTIVAQDVIERMKARAVLMQVGTTELNLSGIGKFDLPRVSASATAQWLGELDEITESSLTFDKVTLDPKKVAALVRMSRELLADANQSVENIVRNDMASQLALAVDEKGLLGTGLSDTPLGIINTPGIGTYAVGTNGDDASFQTFDELIGLLEDENALRGNLAFISNPRVFRALRNQTVLQFSGQPSGSPIYTPLVSDSQLEAYLGYKIGKTTQIPKTGTKGTGTALSKLIFGNFDDLIYATWGGLEIDASDVAGDNFVKYSVQLRAVMRCDFAVRQPKSFAVATDIGTVAVNA